MKVDVNQELQDIFGDSPVEVAQEFDLPSRGIFYPSKISRVKIRPLTFEDEKLVITARKARNDPTDSLLAACVQGVPADFVSNLVIIDKIFLVIKLREISFGKFLKSQIHCPACAGIFEVNVNLEEIPVNTFDKDEQYLQFTLPKLKKSVKLKPVKARDQKLFDAQGATVYNELYKFIETLAGKSETLILSEATKKLHVVDTQTILQRITLEGYGIDPRFEYVCEGEGGCGYRGLMSIPIDEDFFSVKSVGSE